ncbi:hypothetical protein B0H13DRAFT_2279841, partial [Mycena leptocephala]
MVHASDILSEREYLLKDFDPNRLSVSVLAGVLAFHAIEIPSKRNKKELVTLWKLNITERRVKLLKEHDARQNIKPSSEGILDGITGKPVSVKPGSIAQTEKPRQPIVTEVRACRGSSQNHEWSIQANGSQRVYRCTTRSCGTQV